MSGYCSDTNHVMLALRFSEFGGDRCHDQPQIGASPVGAVRGLEEHTPKRDPRTERMTMAKREITTLCAGQRQSQWFQKIKPASDGENLPRPGIQCRHDGLHPGVVTSERTEERGGTKGLEEVSWNDQTEKPRSPRRVEGRR